MSELNDDIDKLFREIVDPTEMQPPPMVWTSIENNLDKKQHLKLQKKLKRLVSYSVASSVIIVTLVSVLWYKEHSVQKNIYANNVVQNKIESKSESTTAVPNTNSVSPIVENNKVQERNTNENNKVVDNNKVVTSDISKKTDEKQYISPIVNKQKTTSPIIKEVENKTPYNNAVTLENETSPQKEDIIVSNIPTSFVKTDTEELKDEVKNNNSNIVVAPQEPVEAEKQNSLPSESLNSSIKITETKTENNATIVSKSDLKADTAKPDASPLTVKGADTAKTPAPLLPIKDFKFFVGGMYCADKVMTGLINVNANDNPLHETQNYSYSTGVRFGYKFSKNWSLYTNILYTSTSKSFDYYQATIEHDDDDHDRNVSKEIATSYGAIYFPTNYVEKHPEDGEHPHHDGDTLIIDINGVMKLKYLTVPLACQYQITKNRFSGIFSLGFSSSILLSQSAEITYANLDTKYSTKISGIQDVYFNGTIGIGVQYRIFNRLSVFIQPTFSQAFTPMNTNTPYKTYPSSLSGSGGINFHF